jgi:hypothetical protein
MHLMHFPKKIDFFACGAYALLPGCTVNSYTLTMHCFAPTTSASLGDLWLRSATKSPQKVGPKSIGQERNRSLTPALRSLLFVDNIWETILVQSNGPKNTALTTAQLCTSIVVHTLRVAKNEILKLDLPAKRL